MAHDINAIIGSRQTLANLIERLGRPGRPGPTELTFGLSIMPLDERRLDLLAMSVERPFDGFTYLKLKMADEIGRTLNQGFALYVETNYFGGTGCQSAALFENGKLVWKGSDRLLWEASHKLVRQGSEHSDPPVRSPINQGLKKMGVVPLEGKDAFDSVGLGRFRCLEALGLTTEEE